VMLTDVAEDVELWGKALTAQERTPRDMAMADALKYMLLRK
jgi:hypothetical protein